LEQMNAWGRRVDRLVTSTAWQDMKAVAAQEGFVASGYQREFDEWSRLYQMAQFYLYEPSAGLYGCPLAMTNGAARTIEHPWLYNEAFPRLTSRDPQTFWTSGQWMTERRGGSDVAGGTETVAVKQPDGTYKLYGYKWFSSATDADITLTLARVVDDHGNTVKGTRGLSLFYLDVKGQRSNIQLVKLKNKLGTRQLPTAELLIEGATAHKICDDGRGVSSMSQMLTLTRIHTAVHAAGAMRRIVNLARDYATRRQAFGRLLINHPLHVHTLANMEVQTRAAAIFALEVSRLLGRQEMLERTEQLEMEKNVLRLAVPLLKLYVSKKSVSLVSEGLECFGGQGYIEDTDLPRILRDTQVTSIWEGTTNILSLDVLRAIRKSAGESSSSSRIKSENPQRDVECLPPVLRHFQRDVRARVSSGKDLKHLQVSATRLEVALDQVLKHWVCLEPQQQDMSAREMAFSLARIYMGALLVEHAAHPLATVADVYTAQRWCECDLVPLCTRAEVGSFTSTAQDLNLELVFEGFSHSN
ncbi:novel acyl-coa-dehydrogenase protein, partial [Plakobranchus ocellatus]